MRRRWAREAYHRALHEPLIRGPEGESEQYNDKGKRQKGGGKVRYLGYEEHLEALLCEMLGVEPEVIAAMREIKRGRETMSRISSAMGGRWGKN